jgi:glycosyltransferase involved in cell wall biosynthesis
MNYEAPVRTAFVMEQALGHVTHYRNLRDFTDRQPDIDAEWLPISFDVRGPARMVPLLRSNWSIRASWRARRALANLSVQPEVAVFHTQVTSLFSAGYMRRVPSIISLDATPINYDAVGEYYGHRPAGGGLLDARKFEMNRNAFHAAAVLVAWSDWAKRSLVSDYGVDDARVRVLAPGAGPVFFDIGHERPRRSKLADGGRVKLLFVGADFRRKGGPELLKCMAGPLGAICELHVATQSDVPAQPNVIVHRGLQANSDGLLKLFEEADIFVLPTHADCLGVALMEASAAGLPVITTTVGALSEAVEDGQTGLLMPPGDTDALHAALFALAQDAARRERMGRAAFALAWDKFDARKNNRAMLDLIHEIAGVEQRSRRAA